MSCKLCEKNQAPQGVPQVLEIINKEKPILFHKVVFPASIGDDETNPPDTLNYKNVLLQYEANNHVYLYSSDGAATMLPTGATDLTAIKETLAQHGVDIENLQTDVATLQSSLELESQNREEADDTLRNSIAEETQNRQDADTTLQEQIENNAQSLQSLTSTVAGQGDEITSIKENLDGLTEVVNTQAEEIATAQGDITELENTTTTNTNNISSLTSEVTALKSDVEDNTQAIDQNTSSIDAVKTTLNQAVEQSTAFDADQSTITVTHSKVNLNTDEKTTASEALPVASSTEAGVMNVATFSAVQNNSDLTNALLNGAVAITGLSEEPTQTELSDAWKEATGLTTLINRASIFDSTHQKIWTYYTNDSTWHATGTTEGITVSQATNDSLGIVKGSEMPGQNYVEADGSLSLNGWDATQSAISTLQSTASSQGETLASTVSQLDTTIEDVNDALGDIAAIQADYVSKTNIKSINGESLLGTGNITVMSSIPVLASRYYTSTDAIMVRRDIADTLANELPIGSIIAMVVLGDTTTFTTLPAIDNTQYPIRLMGASYLTASSPSTSLIAYPNTVYVLEFDGEYWNVLNTNKQVATTDIASSAVTSTKLASGAVTESKIASSAIMTPEEFKAAWEAA